MVGDVEVGDEAVEVGAHAQAEVAGGAVGGDGGEVGARGLLGHPVAALSVGDHEGQVGGGVVAVVLDEPFQHRGRPEEAVGVELEGVLEELGGGGALRVEGFAGLADLVLIEVGQGGAGGVGVQEAGDALFAVAGPEGGQSPAAFAVFPVDDGVGALPRHVQHGEGVLVHEGGALGRDDLGGLAPGVAGGHDAGLGAAFDDARGHDGEEGGGTLAVGVVEGAGDGDGTGTWLGGVGGCAGRGGVALAVEPGDAVLELLGGVLGAARGVGGLERPGGAERHGDGDAEVLSFGQHGAQGGALGVVGPETG